MNDETPNDPYPPVLQQICRALDEKKAEDLRILRVDEQSSITDYLVLATGTSEPHLRALRVELEKVIDAARVRIVGIDTGQESGWLVIDAFDIMIHLFTAENREKYSLENLWKDAAEVSLADLLASPRKKAPARARSGTRSGAKKIAAGKTARKPARKKKE